MDMILTPIFEVPKLCGEEERQRKMYAQGMDRDVQHAGVHCLLSEVPQSLAVTILLYR